MTRHELEAELQRANLDPDLEEALQRLLEATLAAAAERQQQGEPRMPYKDD